MSVLCERRVLVSLKPPFVFVDLSLHISEIVKPAVKLLGINSPYVKLSSASSLQLWQCKNNNKVIGCCESRPATKMNFYQVSGSSFVILNHPSAKCMFDLKILLSAYTEVKFGISTGMTIRTLCFLEDSQQVNFLLPLWPSTAFSDGHFDVFASPQTF